MAIRADGQGQRLARLLAGGEAVILRTTDVALRPHRLGRSPQPIRGDHREGGARVAQRLAHHRDPVERADGGQHMRRIRPLPSPRFEQMVLPAPRQESIEQPLSAVAYQQPGAEFAEHGGIEARVGRVQPQDVLPIDATADGIGRLPVR